MPRLESKGLAVRRLTPTELMVMTGYVQLACSGQGVGLEEYQQLLRSLAAVDKNGKLWSLGVNSGTWYRQDGEDWVPGRPEGDLYLIRAVEFVTNCPSCGKKNPAGKHFCTRCGSKLPPPRLPGKRWPDQKMENRQSLPANACPQCGHENKPGAKFCSRCGTQLQD